MSLITDFKNLRESALISTVTAAATGIATLGLMTSAVASRTDGENSKLSVNALKNIIVSTVPLVTLAVLSNRLSKWNLK